jgi:hypothetical protein
VGSEIEGKKAVKKPILFILLGLIAIAIFVFLHLWFVTLLRTQGVEENLARLTVWELFVVICLGVVWLWSRRLKPNLGETRYKNISVIWFLAALWLLGKPLLQFGLEWARLQDSWWGRWMDNFDLVILIVALGLIWGLDRRNLADGDSRLGGE